MAACPIWTYWEGPQPAYIQACLSSMAKVCGNRFKVVTPETLDDYVDMQVLDSNWKRLPHLACRVGCIRAALIHQHGGWWCDADSVGVRQWPKSPGKHFTYTTWRTPRVLNGYFGARKGNHTVTMWIVFINKVLSRFDQQRYWWTTLGECLLTPSVLMYGGRFVHTNTWIPVDFQRDPQIFLRKLALRPFMHKRTLCIGLNNSWLQANAAGALSLPVAEQAKSKLLLHQILTLARRTGGLTDTTNIAQ